MSCCHLSPAAKIGGIFQGGSDLIVELCCDVTLVGGAANMPMDAITTPVMPMVPRYVFELELGRASMRTRRRKRYVDQGRA
jgi:hypothetical protein